MKRFKHLASLILALAMVPALVACGQNGAVSTAAASSVPASASSSSDSATYKITIGGTVPDEHPISQGIFEFQKQAEALSDGRIQVDFYDNNTLGGSGELLQEVKSGELQMCECSQSEYANFTEELMSVGLPFLFKNREAAYAFFDSEVGQQLADAVNQETGIRIVGYFENGIRQLTNNKREILTPDDMKGLKIRVMNSPLYIEMFSEMGANPTPMSFSELYTALQQGTVDGQDNPYAIVATNKFDEVQKYMTDLSHTFDITCFSINDAFYQSLPSDLQAVVDEAAADAVKVNREQSQANEQTYIKDIQDSGCKITFLTDAQREAFKEATAGTYDFFREKYNPTVSLDTVLAEAQTVNEAN